MGLKTYQRKRDFLQTSEPRGSIPSRTGNRFVVQEHHASRLHFDFRLEIDGVLKSWAVPKGPSLQPAVKRLAVQVEDHPVDYIEFEGTIAPGNYGAGEVAVWDVGTYDLTGRDSPAEGLKNGKLSFNLHGEKLRGEFALIRMAGHSDQWLLVKADDEYADSDWELKLMIEGGTGRTNGSKKPRPSTAADSGKGNGISREQLSVVPGARKSPMPRNIRPMLATLVGQSFDDEDWVFETKWDGIRALAYIDGSGLRIVSRNGTDLRPRYPELESLGSYIDAKTVVLDGEIVALDEHGAPSFQLLQQRISLRDRSAIRRLEQTNPVVYYVFDLLYQDGYNLMSASLIDRKRLLKKILKASDIVKMSEHVAAEGVIAFEAVKRKNLEGIVAKHSAGQYKEGRSAQWLKIKATKRHEAVIAGYTKPRNSREYLGALVLGLYDVHGTLHYVGHAGGGFTRELLRKVYQLLQPMRTTRSPFKPAPKTNEPVQWVKPKIVCEVKYSEWTADKRMRHPVFIGIREDRRPAECTFEVEQDASVELRKGEHEMKESLQISKTPKRARSKVVSLEDLDGMELSGNIPVRIGSHTVSLTHLEKLYWPEDGLTKGDLIRYYAKTAEYILPYLKDRPVILKRYPNGIDQASFYQHDFDEVPEFVQTLTVNVGSGRTIDYAICNNIQTLLYLANLGTIAQNPWHSRAASLEYPDWMVFDLDPEKAEWSVVCKVALEIRTVLKELSLDCYPKTSGARGLHMFVPIQSAYDYATVGRFAHDVAMVVARRRPEIATIERSLSKRKPGMVYIDYLQNAEGKTITSVYSVRAKKGATVSAPLDWMEVKLCVPPSTFTMTSMAERFSEKGEMFNKVLTRRQTLDDAFEKLDLLYQESRRKVTNRAEYHD